MSSIPSTPPRPDAPQLMDEQLRNRICPFHNISTFTQLITLLSEQRSTGHSFLSTYSQLFRLIVSKALVTTSSSEQHSQVSGPQPPPRLKSSRLRETSSNSTCSVSPAPAPAVISHNRLHLSFTSDQNAWFATILPGGSVRSPVLHCSDGSPSDCTQRSFVSVIAVPKATQ